MHECPHEGCGWRAVAPSASAAADALAAHVVDEHARRVDVDIPEGMVQVRFGPDEEWVTVTPEEARLLHEQAHRE